MSPITDASTTISRSSSLDKKGDSMSANNVLSYDVFVSDPIPQNVTGLLPNGETHMFSPLSTTLIYGKNDAVLVDPPLTTDQAKAVGDWVETFGKKITFIFATHGHGDHWFTAGVLAERFGARVVASACTIEQMHFHVSIRESFWDKLWPGQIPPSPVTADALLRKNNTAPDFFKAMLKGYPNRRLGATTLWAGTRSLYAQRDGRGAEASLAGWL
jgi:glyoxylase-like metal-dependent hydrolase (beta-lactamase superfamily II)